MANDKKPKLNDDESAMLFKLMRSAPRNLKFIVLDDKVTAINIDLLGTKELSTEEALAMDEEGWRKFFEDCKPLI